MKNTYDPGGIALDIDDTLCDTARVCIRSMYELFGMQGTSTLDDLLTLYDQPGIVPEWQTTIISKWVEDTLRNEEFLINLPVFPKASEAIEKIHAHIPISMYITSRESAQRQVTEHWLSKNGFPKAPLITRDTSVVATNWKIHYMLEHDVRLHSFIDDTYTAFEQVEKVPIELPVWFRKGKKTPSPSHVTAADTWEQIVDLLLHHFSKKTN